MSADKAGLILSVFFAMNDPLFHPAEYGQARGSSAGPVFRNDLRAARDPSDLVAAATVLVTGALSIVLVGFTLTGKA